MNALRWIGFTLIACAASSSADAGVIVLQGASGAALQNAIDSAADGDTILVKGAGNFDPIAIVSKGLTIVAEPAGTAELAHIRIDGLAVNATCSISGFVLRAGSFPDRIEITNCAGAVRLAELVPNPFDGFAMSLGAFVSNCQNVVFTRCVVNGNDSAASIFPPSTEPRAGLVSVQSRIALFDCQVYGGHGKNTFVMPAPAYTVMPAGPGANGAEIDGSSTLFASNSTIRGGDGGSGTNAFCIGITCMPATPGSHGGTGLQVITGGTATIVGFPCVGGAAGVGGAGGSCCGFNPANSAPNGNAGQDTSGAVTTLPVGVVYGNVPTHARVNQAFPVVVHGVPGDEAFIAASTTGCWLSLPSMSGTLVAGPLLRRISLGPIPGSGVLQTTLSIPELAGLTQSFLLHFQIVTVTPSLQAQLGTGQTICMLGPAF